MARGPSENPSNGLRTTNSPVRGLRGVGCGCTTALHDTIKVDYIAPGHCTGESFAALQKAFGDRYLYAGLGTTLDDHAQIFAMPTTLVPSAQTQKFLLRC